MFNNEHTFQSRIDRNLSKNSKNTIIDKETRTCIHTASALWKLEIVVYLCELYAHTQYTNTNTCIYIYILLDRKSHRIQNQTTTEVGACAHDNKLTSLTGNGEGNEGD